MDSSYDANWVEIAFIGVGALLSLMGLLIRLGTVKTWFSLKRVPGVVIPRLAFGLIPGGLAVVLWGILARFVTGPESAERLMSCVVLPLMALSIVFAALEPRFILPRWYRWLKDNYGNILPRLHEDAQRIGQWEWQRMVRTQEGLGRWAEEVRQRHQAEHQ